MSSTLCVGVVCCGSIMGIPMPKYLEENLEFNHQDFALFHVKNSSHDKYFLRAMCLVVNIFITPFILVFQSVYIYLIPCVGVTINRLIIRPIMDLLHHYNFLNEVFIDPSFPHNSESLGNRDKCEWIRVVDLKPVGHKTDAEVKKPVLFDRVSMESVSQGELGDCWLLAAFATLCSNPEFIQRCFLTRELNPYGKYKIRLFDIAKHAFVTVEIDDYVPCRNGLPIYCRYKENTELWPILLEKAYAKYKGSFEAISGGMPLNALKTLTGYEGDTIMSPFHRDGTFEKLRKYLSKGCLLAAASRGYDNSREVRRSKVSSSIVGGHAYTIVDVLKPTLTTGDVRLVKMRNPWGEFEWDGDWSDKSELWKKHPGVKLTINPKDRDDGIFYMSFDDFMRYFEWIDVLYPNYGFDNLRYKVDESKCCGPTVGCVTNCASYWFLCRGLMRLWSEKTSEELKEELDAIDKNNRGAKNSKKNVGSSVVADACSIV